MRNEPTYDTAGSAKMIKENNLRDCAAIASDLAGMTYGLDVLDTNIEDHDNNFTRFLLLARQAVSSLIPPNMPAKTSIVFSLPHTAGALYRALACFSLRDIDFCKIESRPTSVQLLNFLQFKQMQASKTSAASNLPGSEEEFSKFKGTVISDVTFSQDLPRFQYTFYLDFLASEFDDRAQNALLHLREQSQFVRVLGSFPRNGQLVGPIKAHLENLAKVPITTEYPSAPLPLPKAATAPLKIGIIGFGKFGQFLARTFVQNNHVYCVSKEDKSAVAKELGCEYFPLYDLTSFAKVGCDVIVMAVSIISFEEVIRMIPKEMLRGKLIVDVLSVKVLHLSNPFHQTYYYSDFHRFMRRKQCWITCQMIVIFSALIQCLVQKVVSMDGRDCLFSTTVYAYQNMTGTSNQILRLPFRPNLVTERNDSSRFGKEKDAK